MIVAHPVGTSQQVSWLQLMQSSAGLSGQAQESEQDKVFLFPCLPQKVQSSNQDLSLFNARKLEWSREKMMNS